MLDVRVVIDRTDEINWRFGEDMVYTLPVDEDEVCSAIGFRCLIGRAYTIKPFCGDCILTIKDDTTIFDINFEYSLLSMVDERCPELIDRYEDGVFDFGGVKLPLLKMIEKLPELYILNGCNSYKDIDKQFNYDWSNYYYFAFGKNKAFLLGK